VLDRAERLPQAAALDRAELLEREPVVGRGPGLQLPDLVGEADVADEPERLHERLCRRLRDRPARRRRAQTLDRADGGRPGAEGEDPREVDDRQQAALLQVDAIAAPDATVLLIAWVPKRRGPLPRGASQAEVERAFPGWTVTEAGASHFEAPKPIEVLLKPDERWYRLRRASTR